MTHNFSQTPTIQAPRSQFDRSNGHKFTMNAGWLVPFYWDDVLPGDTFNAELHAFARLATPLFPIMDNMFIDTHFFFVPYRILWDNSKKFFGEQTDPSDSIDFQIPILTGAAIASNADADLSTATGQKQYLLNIMGVPDGIDPTLVDINALPFRAYQRIWTEWFRDQNLIDSPTTYSTGDGPDSVAGDALQLRKRGKRHDYFTSALPWPQKGDAVLLPIGSTAPIINNTAITAASRILTTTSGIPAADTLNTTSAGILAGASGTTFYRLDPQGTLLADLSSAASATVNDQREAFQVQKLLEKDARGGTRYNELVANHFGVNFYDISYRPEYLGGGSTPINSTPVASTVTFTGGNQLGDLAAFSTASFTEHGFTKSFVEHGIVMGFVSVRADLTYQQGVPRHFLKKTRYDIYWPSLAHLGEQEITNAEIYYQDNAILGTTGEPENEEIFGYQERHAEYRYNPSRITGAFRSNAAAPLDAWHLSQEFVTKPVLGDTFITENPPVDRIIAVPTEPHFIFDSYTKLRCARPMPMYGVPGLIDHF